MIQQIARAEDLAFLTGATGVSNPVGLKNQTGIQTAYAAGTTLADVSSAILGCIASLETANVRMIRPTWIMHPRVKAFIQNLRDGVGNYFELGHELTERGTLRGYPVLISQQLPVNLANYVAGTSGTAGTDIFIADFADVVIGDTLNTMLDVSTEGSYNDGTQLQSAFSKDMTLFRIIKETDLELRHPQSVYNLKADSWLL